MKKAYTVVLIMALAFLALGAIACKSQPVTQGEERLAANTSIPSFMISPPTDPEYIFGFGSSKLSNTNMARQAALASARTDIATKLNVEVQAMIVDYSRSAGTENNQTSLAFFESVSRQLSDETLRGVEEVRWEQTGDGAFWVLLRMNKAEAAAAAAAAVQDVLENEASRYAEFKAMDALKMMDAQLNK